MAHTPILGSIHNPRVREALGLREPRERRRRGLMLIDGAREIARAVAAGVEVVEAFVADELVEAAGVEAAGAAEAIRSTGAARVPVTSELMGRMAYGDRSDGLLAVARVPDASIEALAALVPTEPLLLVLEAVEKPGNLGAVLRTADGAGIDGLIVADPRTDPWNPNAIRASMGTVFSVPLAVTDGATARGWLEERGVRVVATLVDAPTTYTEADLTGPLAIALGSEAEGLGGAWRGDGVTGVRIPMLGIADSLNVSVSAAILAYEARRQRG
ncbi:MAG: TrmH family RNA methyltransferase [Candidatus Limnocylindrales bacterium]